MSLFCSQLPRLVLSSTSRRLPRSISRMPLRAKIHSGNMSEAYTPAPVSIESLQAQIKADPENDPNDIMLAKENGARILTLNRPAKLNSLNSSMARKLLLRLKTLESSDMANVIILRGEGRALCAGGDVATLAKWNQEPGNGWQKSVDYFALEYILDHVIATYTKPYVAYMDGITMGGGVGLSVHAPFRIATEKTVFAMPETTIGFFPEVGATFFLPRLDGEMGTYLALTSDQLRGVDVFYHGIATHYLHSSSLEALTKRLGELQFQDHDSLDKRYKVINEVIAEFDSGLPAPRPAIHGEIRNLIDSCFSKQTLTGILHALGRAKELSSGEAVQTWADKTIKTIEERSPIGVSVTLDALRAGKDWSIAQAFQNELEISSVFMRHPDFVTGVTARLIERIKGRPDWKPNSLPDVKSSDVSPFFRNINRYGESLQLMHTSPEANYQQYPHRWLALPTEREIRDVVVTEDAKSKVLQRFLKKTNHKVGVKEKVEEVLERCALFGS